MPVRSGIETEIGAIGGSADTPPWAEPGTDVDAGATMPTPDASSPGASRPGKPPPIRVVSSVRTITSSARALRSLVLSWSSDSVSRPRISSTCCWPRSTLPRSSSSEGLKTRWRDSPTTSCGTRATVVQAWSSSFCEEVRIPLMARRDPATWSARVVNLSRLASTWRRWAS
jgi:hypothetical protein